jgi:PAS domain S-box-containing protein/diguanylate cyclase (GGDEF)-like protein
VSELGSNVVPLLPDDPLTREALSDALLAASSLLDPSAVAQLTVRHLRDQCGADGAALYWWDDAEQVLLPLAVLDPHARSLHQVFHPRQGVTGAAFATGMPVIANDYPTGVEFPPAWKVAEGVRAVAAVPLVVHGQVCGVLTLTEHHEAELTDGDVELMQRVGEQVAPTLHSMRALAHAQFRLSEARELSSLIRDSATSTDVTPLLDRICELSCRMLGTEFAGVVLPTAGGDVWAGIYGSISDRPGWRREARDWPLLPSLMDGEPLLLSDLGDNPDLPLDAMPVVKAQKLRTVLAVPLMPADGDLLGVLVLGWRLSLTPSLQLVGLGRTLGAAATSLLTQARTIAALHDRETLWRLTLDNAPVGICLVHLNGTFRLVNDAMSGILGYAADDLLAREFATVLDPTDVRQGMAAFDRLLADGGSSQPIQVRCVHADGHVVWSLLSVELVRDVDDVAEYFCVLLEDITSQHEQTAQLTHLATHDQVTGLANRRLFYDLLNDRVSRSGDTLVALLEVPQLHGLEDRLGHLSADEVVRALSDRLAECIDVLGASDSVDAAARRNAEADGQECLARFASDEFAVMLTPRAGQPAEEMVLDRLASAFTEPFTVAGRSHRLSAHIGVAVSPAHGSTAQDLLRAADIALASARQDSAAVRQYSTAMGDALLHRQRLMVDLRAAVADGGLSVAYQPIIDGDGRLVSAEALARWTHPEFGAVGPDAFIPLAEESGVMPALTAWVLDTALASCARWQRDKPGVAVAVNLAATDLQDPTAVQGIAEALRRNQLPPELLEIELTETTLMTDPLSVATNLNHLAALGVKLAIDDFGTGYSSFTYLQHLPATTLKIDRSFVTTMLTDTGNAAIVTMVLQLARTLGLTTVAEGVEDAETRDRLNVLHCDRQQGYGIARPMPEDQFATWRAT